LSNGRVRHGRRRCPTGTCYYVISRGWICKPSPAKSEKFLMEINFSSRCRAWRRRQMTNAVVRLECVPSGVNALRCAITDAFSTMSYSAVKRHFSHFFDAAARVFHLSFPAECGQVNWLGMRRLSGQKFPDRYGATPRPIRSKSVSLLV